MAKNDDLLQKLRKSGIRDKVAKTLADATGSGSRRSKAPKVVTDAAKDLRKLAAELEDRAKGGPGKRKSAAKKAAATRKKNAAKRSAAAKKGAKTRAKKATKR